ncbi:MAG TPA: hypothetical protein VGI66_08535 [Streptosporangiaceae bacterium]
MRTDDTPPAASPARCPGCGRAATGSNCSGCGIWLAGPQAAELWWIEGELRRVDQARTWLVERRTALLAELTQMSAAASRAADSRSAAQGAQPDAMPGHAVKPAATTGTQPIAPPGPRRRPELTGGTVGRLLLAVGAVLIMIATTVFTVASWSRIGPQGRFGILVAVTAAVLVVPVFLKRRALTATAETVAATGLVLTVADAYLALRLARADSLFVVAATCAVLAVSWAGYGLATRLRIPRLAAIAAAQFPGLVVTVALVRMFGGPTLAGPIALALVLTAGADLVASRRMKSYDAEALAASIAGTVTWAAAVVLALLFVTVSPSPWMAGVLVTAGAIGTGLRPAWIPVAPAALMSGALVAIGLALPAAHAMPSGWKVVPFAAAGAIIASVALVLDRAARLRAGDEGERSPRPRLVAAGSAAIVAVAGLAEIRPAAAGMFPLRRLTHIWSGPASPPATSHLLAVALAPSIVLALVSLTCWLAPLPRPSWQRCAALGFAALAAGSIPAAGLAGWASLAVLTGAAAIALCMSAALGTGEPALAAACSAVGLAIAAVVWSLTWADATIAELSVLVVMFCIAAAWPRTAAVAQLTAGCALAAVAGVAWAVPLANGWPARHAAFAVLGVAVAAAAVATLLRTVRPDQAIVLDLGAGPVVVLAAAMAAQQAATFAVLAAVTAVTASSAAWLRAGRRRVIAVCGGALAAVAAIAAVGHPLALALFGPYGHFAAPWHGPAQVHAPASVVIVAGACAAAFVIAIGAWRDGQASLNVVAIALPVVVAPAGLVSGLGYGAVTGVLLALAIALIAWTAASRSLVPAAAALAATSLALAWALAEREATLIVLGCLAVAYPLCTWRSRLADVRTAAAFLSVLAAAGLVESAALAAGWPVWTAGLAVLGVAACAQAVAALLATRRGEASSAPAASDRRATIAIEVAGWLAVVAGAAQCLNRPGQASLALALSGLIAAGVAMRNDRRAAVWASAVLGEAAWSVWLFSSGVTAPEPYTVPVAAAWLAVGWHLRRRVPSSWLTFGPGLALLLVPSLIAVWYGQGWIRPLSLGVVAAAITLIGGRARWQAPLLIGATVTVLDAGHELAPDIRRLAETVPTWLPIAVAGAVLLWSGATYEARLRNLSNLRKVVAAMR